MNAPARRFGVSVAVIACVGFVWRVVYGFVIKRPVDACGSDRCGDAVYYVAQARRHVAGALFDDPAAPGMPAADHPPVTAVLLTPAALFRGHDVLASRLTMTIIGTLVIVLLAMLGRRLAGPTAGIITAALAAANPNLWMNDALPMSEAPSALAIAVVFLATWWLVDRPGWARAAALGAACGLAVLTRAELALLVPFAIAPVLIFAMRAPALRHWDWRRRLGLAAVVGAVGVAVVLPWSAWNTMRFSEPVLLSTNDGLTLIGANCDTVYRTGGIGFWSLQCAEAINDRVPTGADQAARSRIYRQEGLSYMADNLDRLPVVLAVRVGRVFGIYENHQMVWLNTNEGRERWASWAGLATWWVLAPVAITGGVVLHRRRQLVWPLAATVPVVLVTALAFYGIVRFRLPVDVASVPLAGVAIAAGSSWWHRRHKSSPTAPGNETPSDGAATPTAVASPTTAATPTSTG
jgi:4-amino-4-deoxy-L-arabinose transferase-like glycosyltransferase